MILATRAAKYLTTIIMREPPAWEDLKRWRRTTAPAMYGAMGIMRPFWARSSSASSRTLAILVNATRIIPCDLLRPVISTMQEIAIAGRVVE
jgi:hypothetical protein